MKTRKLSRFDELMEHPLRAVATREEALWVASAMMAQVTEILWRLTMLDRKHLKAELNADHLHNSACDFANKIGELAGWKATMETEAREVTET